MSFWAGVVESALLGAFCGLVLAPAGYEPSLGLAGLVAGPTLITIWEMSTRRKRRETQQRPQSE